MKKSLFLVLFMLATFSSFASCCPPASQKQEPFKAVCVYPDSVVYASLGRTLSDVLFNPSKVTLYKLRGKETVAKNDYEVEPHYVRDTLIGRVRREVWTIFQFNVLANNVNYQNDSIPVRSPYVPEYELEFVRGKSVAHVIFSPSDYTWSVIYDDKKQFNWNYSDKESMSRFFDLLFETTKKKK